jgi:DNA-binding MarR family transcriptional regulator
MEQVGGLTELKYRDLLIRTLELVEGEFGTDLPISSLILLLKIPTKGAIPMTQIVKSSKLTPAGTSRTIATLAGFSKSNRREIDKPYFELTEDQQDRRYKYVSFTDYGKQFINRMLSVIN